jgi:hydrogenase/urease accessory protein HupE
VTPAIWRGWFRVGAAMGCALVGLISWASDVVGHQMNLSNARIELGSNRIVRVDVGLKGSDVDRVAGTAVFNQQTGLVDAGRLAGSAPRIAAYVTAHAVVEGVDRTPCKLGAATVDPDQDGVAVRITWWCSAVSGELVYRSTLLIDVDRAAKQVVVIGNGSQAPQALLDASQTELTLTTPPRSRAEVIGRYVEVGIEHIFLGYDHVAFLVAIVLWARRLWPVIKIVTAFTLAHSITLSLAALQVVVIPSTIVEPAIAASIVYVALENFVSREVNKRWRDTFVFGLIHGFGFASALQEFGLPPGAVVPALGAFNVGVELGQVAIVSIVVPTLIGLDRLMAVSPSGSAPRTASLVYAVSGFIAVLGCYWMLDRIALA